jgi:hypothetical protein
MLLKNKAEAPMIISEIDDITKGVLETKVDPRQSPPGDIQKIIACVGGIKEHLRVVSLDRHFFNDDASFKVRDDVITREA